MFRARRKGAIAGVLSCSLPTLFTLLVSLPGSADEFYDKEGAITSLATCLQIAAEPGTRVLHRRITGTADPDGQVGDAGTVLAEIGDYRPTHGQGKEAADAEHAFSVLLMCAHIVHAWDEYGSAKSPEESQTGSGFDRTHQALVISPGDQERRLRLPPGPLVRLVGTPKLLPPAYVSGLVIKHAIVDGPLLLNHAVISGPVTFTNVVFMAGDYSKAILGEPDTEGRAVSMLGVRFRDQVSFAGSTFCGDVMIKDSHFDEQLLIKYANKLQHVCDAAGTALSSFDEKLSILNKSLNECAYPEGSQQHQISLNIIGSHFNLGLSITDSWISRLSITDAHANLLTIADNLFDQLKIINSSLATAYLVRNMAVGSIEILVNRLDGDLWIEDAPTGSISNPLEIITTNCNPVITIANNKIGGGLGFIRRTEYFTSTDVELTSNVAKNGSEVELPEEWRGRLDLTGSEFLGTLEFRGGSPSRLRHDNGYCPPFGIEETRTNDPVYIDLTGVSVRMLRWNLPFDCDYRWQGTGLHYEVWQALTGNETRHGARGHHDPRLLRLWRTLLAEPRVDELNTISNYLDRHGEFNASRDILQEAKRLNYAPDCSPEHSLLACLFPTSLQRLFAPQAIADGTAAGRPSASQRAALAVEGSAVWDRVVLLLLWPVGYGARPEFAVLLLAGTPFPFWGFYTIYRRLIRRRARRHWDHAVELLNQKDLTTKDRERLGEIKHAFEIVWTNRPTFAQEHFDKRLQDIKDDIVRFASDLKVELNELRMPKSDLENLGNSAVSGFSQFDQQRLPRRFPLFLFSLDSMLPVVDLHHYSTYYPEGWYMRPLPIIQQILGWWWSTVFIAAAAIL